MIAQLVLIVIISFHIGQNILTPEIDFTKMGNQIINEEPREIVRMETFLLLSSFPLPTGEPLVSGALLASLPHSALL